MATDERRFACRTCLEDNGVHIDSVEMLNAAGQSVRVDARGEDERASLTATMSSGNPYAGRRHTVRLYGWCEHCSLPWIMDLRQHKGVTLIEE
jgi:hypothetical protein